MGGFVFRILLVGFLTAMLLPAQQGDERLEKFLFKLRQELARLPDYVCTQTVKRMSRAHEARAWESLDVIRLDVALVGDTELYGKPGAKTFEKQPVASWVGQGAFSRGKFGSLAKHLFLGGEAAFEYRGEAERDGRKVHEYFYDVAPERSSYRLKAGDAEHTVGFQGSFWIDAENLDLVELEVQAYDIPASLGLSEASSLLRYKRFPIGGEEVLLPVQTTLELITSDGGQNRNVAYIDSCRQYQAESHIRFAESLPPSSAGEPTSMEEENDGPHLAGLLELQLESPLDPTRAAAGGELRARVSRPVREGETVLIPEGAQALGRLLRVERQGALPVYEIALEFDTLAIGSQRIPLSATLERAGPAAGLIKHAKNMMPSLRSPDRSRMSILVSEVRRGQGTILWDVRKGVIPRGFRMKWRVQDPPVNLAGSARK
ncbi:MAG: hypothetical protein NZV14_00345 [Bryobacteraceae bacterium]|nr:hypothetical protein [Bryobacteraceae bacterium]MDW8376581.1 hypothetical protein [Bryobacterales bacterium]